MEDFSDSPFCLCKSTSQVKIVCFFKKLLKLRFIVLKTTVDFGMKEVLGHEERFSGVFVPNERCCSLAFESTEVRCSCVHWLWHCRGHLGSSYSLSA